MLGEAAKKEWMVATASRPRLPERPEKRSARRCCGVARDLALKVLTSHYPSGATNSWRRAPWGVGRHRPAQQEHRSSRRRLVSGAIRSTDRTAPGPSQESEILPLGNETCRWMSIHRRRSARQPVP